MNATLRPYVTAVAAANRTDFIGQAWIVREAEARLRADVRRNGGNLAKRSIARRSAVA
jgi:hypothetical protein